MRIRVFGPILATGLLGLFALGSCEQYEPPQGYVFHGSFVLGAAHADKGCDSCHVLAASQQGKVSTSPTGWVTPLTRTSCANCHPFVANLEDPTAFCPPDAINPLYDTEKCGYERAHGPVSPLVPIVVTAGCTSCHTVNDTSWLDARGPDPHDDGTLDDVFPLVAGHANLLCDECHNAGQEALERDQGRLCGNCHGRTRDLATGGDLHYPPARAEWVPGQDEHERDCRSCHAKPDTDGSLNWPLEWNPVADPANEHTFLFPHHTVSTWATLPATPLGEAEWKFQCWSCHNVQPNNPDGPGTQNNAPAFVQLDFLAPTCTNGCHSDAHNIGQTCSQANCHPTAGPNDVGTPPI